MPEPGEIEFVTRCLKATRKLHISMDCIMESQKQYPYATGILSCSDVALSMRNVITTLGRDVVLVRR